MDRNLEITEQRRSMARTYLQLLVPSGQHGLSQLYPNDPDLIGQIDWTAALEPAVDTLAASFTEEELARAIAWTETALCQKLLFMQMDIQDAVCFGLMVEMSRVGFVR